jgi:hypothetical protein
LEEPPPIRPEGSALLVADHYGAGQPTYFDVPHRRLTEEALSWLLAKKPWIVPIPGTTELHRLEKNLGAANLDLTSEDLRAIESASSNIKVEGARYPQGVEQTTGRGVDRHRALGQQIGEAESVESARNIIFPESGCPVPSRGPAAPVCLCQTLEKGSRANDHDC